MFLPATHIFIYRQNMNRIKKQTMMIHLSQAFGTNIYSIRMLYCLHQMLFYPSANARKTGAKKHCHNDYKKKEEDVQI